MTVLLLSLPAGPLFLMGLTWLVDDAKKRPPVPTSVPPMGGDHD